MNSNNNERTIYIFGHKNPDTDTVASCISLSYLKNELGYLTEPKILGSLNKETIYVLKKLNINIPKLLQSIDINQKVILVDHNELSQSIDKLSESQILEIIDHHKIGLHTSNPIYIITMPVGSTCTIISQLYSHYKIKIPNYICKLLLYGIMSDTLLFKSPTCTSIDIEEVNKLNSQIGITLEELKTLCMEMFEAGSDIDHLTPEELINMDFKEIGINGKVIGISQLLLLNPLSILKRKNELILSLHTNNMNNNYYLSLLIVTDILNDGSYVFYDSKNLELLDKLFKTSCKQGIFINGLVSRKKQIIPKLSTLIK